MGIYACKLHPLDIVIERNEWLKSELWETTPFDVRRFKYAPDFAKSKLIHDQYYFQYISHSEPEKFLIFFVNKLRCGRKLNSYRPFVSLQLLGGE